MVTLAYEEHDKGKSKDTVDATGDGVLASSTAAAQAGATQSAIQLNDNKADANAALAVQLQEIGQINFSGQGGASIATALSDSVLVDQGQGLTSGGDGISATSSAGSEARLSQSANQTNRNSAVATLDRADIDFDIDLGDSADDVAIDLFGSVGAQVQLVGQANINLQGGLGVATSIAGPVTVYSDDVSAGEDGIVATSTAGSAVVLNQSTTQLNENSATITLPALPNVPASTEFPLTPVEIAAQLEGVLQVNLNGQLGASVATSIANEVYVQNTDVSATIDGIVANSSASSFAGLDQSANQTNKDTESIVRAAGTAPSSTEVQIQPSTTALQIEAVLQANASGQLGATAATSVAGPVTVVSGATPVLLSSEEGQGSETPKGGVDAKNNAIIAQSSAEAGAQLKQTVTQANENTVDATGNAIVQLQLAGQLNLSSQSGASIATAFADQVTVDQFGTATAWNGDGITAASSAVASAPVVQTATQSNSNDASAVAEPSAAVPAIPIEDLAALGGFSAALQAQFVGQVNLSEQSGLAVATAVSGGVTTTSENLSAGGDGIKATSSASASAPVVQTATQTNTNEATATFTPPPIDDLIITDGGVDADFSQVFGDGLALQIQLVGQANLSGQRGVAVATALSDPVTVSQSGYLDAGANGITATSSASAEAPVVQTATQTNTNSAAVTFEGGALEAEIVAEEDVDANIQQLGGTDLALQGQLVGQLNLSSQRGAAIATAISDDVTVHQDGELTAWGGDGIAATSSAVASAPVVQTATQSNVNSAAATFEGQQAALVLRAAEDPEAEDLPELPDASGTITQADGVDVALQGQLVGQVNLSGQRGLAVATAVSGEVVVTSSFDPASGTGIEAISSAEASAPVVQTATQSNKNSATATFGGDVANVATSAAGEAEGQIIQSDGNLRLEADGLDLALQGQLVGQVNLSGQGGLAIATALSDPVSVEQCCYLEAGEGGIVAKSTAKATAPVVQTATQSNLNSAAASFDGDIANYGTDEVPVEGGSVASGSISQADGVDLALQGQLVGQVNLSFQRGAAIATAISDEVSVYQGGELTAWGGNGITAVSSAEASAPVVQTATQTNTNEAAATFSGSTAGLVVSQTDPDEPAPAPEQEETGAGGSIQQEAGVDVALQGQLVGQVNLSGQRGLAVATAISREVSVTSEYDPASGNGIEAISSAEATAPVVQTATQSNKNSATATFGGDQASIAASAEDEAEAGTSPGGFESEDLNVALQGQLVGQVNLSGQGGLAIATALSDPVSVEQCCYLEAGEGGIVAKSTAKATAPVVQTATQSNSNIATATFQGDVGDVTVVGEDEVDGSIQQDGGTDLALQGQLVGQVNLSFQRGAAIATAISDEVSVYQGGELTAWGGNGITAVSSAEASAPVVQTATQGNENSAAATFGGSQAGVVVSETDGVLPPVPSAEPEQEGAGATIQQADGVDIALQGQLVGQVNLSGQRGLAVATAISREVSVTSEYDPASGNGIEAISSAEATAPVVQTATQSNKNSATAAFEGDQANIAANAEGTAQGVIDQGTGRLLESDELDLALQGQLVGQVNLSGQGGLAIATALSDPVSVEQCCYLEAGEGGIIAKSTAKATAPVVQTATQSNSNIAAATFGGDIANLGTEENPVEGGVDAFGRIAQRDGTDLALQGQLVGQVNLSFQRGAAIATAISDEVSVYQGGELTALGGNGITAISSAEASAPVVQTATQSNENSADATFGGSEAGVVVAQTGAGEPLPGVDSVNGDISQADGVDVALQGQLVGQANLSGQRGLAVATAISSGVSVTSEFDPASGNGIVAISSAEASAPVVQTATQSNKNSATATFEGDQANIAANAEGDAGVHQGSIRQIESGLNLESDGLDLALQGQLVGQVNLSGQGGLAIATALSDPVSVEQCCYLEAGEGGIIAKSKAKATAPVVQTATQSNSNSAAASFGGDIANIGSDDAPNEAALQTTGRIAQEQGLDLALQGQLVGQVNLSFQRGAAIATAIADEVTVYQGGELTALGGNGITAISSAEASAPVVQTATQSNENRLMRPLRVLRSVSSCRRLV